MDYYDDEQEFGSDSEGIKQLRAAQKAAQKRIRELEAEIDTFRSSERHRSVADVLAARGLNPKVADLIPADLRDADSINSWIDERSDVFAGAMQAPPQQQSEAPARVAPPANAGLIAETLSAGEPIPGDESQLIAQIRAASSPAELNRLIFGSEMGPSVY
jgi:hypothetical protein